jgi:uncharacterized protein (DUF433 family)
MVVALDNHIIQDSGIVGGKPHIAGHRITVSQIATWHEVMGQSADEIATTYSLSLGDVYAALSYYFDNQRDIELTVQQSAQFVETLRHTIPSKLKRQQNG